LAGWICGLGERNQRQVPVGLALTGNDDTGRPKESHR
jgi:hypothetical protein